MPRGRPRVLQMAQEPIEEDVGDISRLVEIAREIPQRHEDDETEFAGADEVFDMDDAPKNGDAIFLHPAEGEPVKGYWRLTRQFDISPAGRKWVPYGTWSIWRGSMPLGFEPVGWSEVVW